MIGIIPPDAYEPDNAWQTASTLAVGGSQPDHTLHAETDEDWIAFSLGFSTQVTILTSGPSAVDDTLLSLYPSGVLTAIAVDDASGSNHYSRIIAFLDAGDYVLKIEEDGQDATIEEYGVAISTATGEVWGHAFGPGSGGWTDQNTFPRHVGDVDGDGLGDIVGFGNNATYVSLSTGTSFDPPQPWICLYGVTAGGWTSQDLYPRMLGDVNGDDRDDIVAFGNHATYVSLSTGTSFGPPQPWILLYGVTAGGWTSQDLYPRMLGDVNGDGRDDIVAFGNHATYVSLSTGTSFGPPQPWFLGYGVTAGGWSSQDTYPRLLGDVDDDGMDDIVGFGNMGTYVSLSTGTGFSASRGWIAKYGVSSGGWTSQNLYPRFLGHVGRSGDSGQAEDIVGIHHRDIWVTLAD